MRSLRVLVLLAAPLVPSAALAADRPTLSGSWTASALSESWSFGEWTEACGPKPAPKGAGGGAVQIREQGGELSIVGAGRAWSTSECWEQMPGLARVSHSQSGGGRFWRTRCSTPSSDARRATITTTVQATDTSISMSETGQYQVTATDGATCTAQVTRSRSFSLVRRDGEDPAAAASASASAAPSAAPAPTASAAASAPAPPTPKPPPKVCTKAGDPARLEVYPARKVLRPGDRFAFRTVVVDEEGCGLSVKPSWTVSPGPLAAKATVDATGAVQLASDIGEGKLELVASVAGKGVTVSVEVTNPAQYEALLSSGGPEEAEQGAVAIIATGAVGGRTAVAEDAARERKQIFVAIVGGISVCLAFAALVLARRGRRRREEEDEEPAETAADEEPLTDEPAEAGGEDRPQAVIEPASEPAAPAPKAAKRGKICPTCGTRYGAEDMFCGQDGTTLVLLN
ncbi:hypothetical protein [Polyangium aurulentum]|uniref:hypothetical protein n=1 Tax=Polyangium aurulentum TaxID=2567896 RepID=UPI0010AE8ABB|nr:hypothetical protein [Polyangium aurulentum]UQA60881.1 hypothetical protein E8A73_010520 [Polyangium aurulentum]